MAVTTAKSQIDAMLDALPAHLVDRLRALTVDWTNVSISATRLRANNANQGVDRDPKKIRNLIRRRVRVIVPVMIESQESGGAITLG